MDSTTPNVPHGRPTKVRWGCLMLWAVVAAFLAYTNFAPYSGGGRSRTWSPITASTLQAGGIAKGLILYAQDHEGRFPTGTGDANEAFRKLFPYLLQEEKPFYVQGSAWHDEAPQKKPDGKIGSKPDYASCLERGENHWAYVTGLTDSDAPNTPLLADGFVEGKPGQYTNDPTKKGGVWKGTKAIVVYVSGAANAARLSPGTGFRVMKTVKEPNGGTGQVDLFTHEGGLPAEARVLNPW